MTINAWKTNFIGLNKPSKVLSGTAESFVSLNLWPYANGEDDPYWSGGVNPQFYRWQVTFSVNERLHGSHLTRTPFRFNAQDIEVGDFVAGAQDGKVLQIMSILSKTNSEIVAVVEDRLRYNTFRDPSGFGLFTTPGTVIFFQINELGYPMLDPVPGEAASDFADNVMSRFQYLNPLINYLLEKENNGFQQGDAVCIKDGEFVLSDATNVDKFIGTVVHPGPGPHQFILRPANGIIDFVPSLPGDVGDYIYPSIDGSGDLTTSDASRRPIYMKVARSITSSTTGTTANPTGNNGDVIEFNRKMMTLESPTGVYTLDDVVSIINNDTFYHKITASKVGASTSVTSDVITVGSAYGIVAGYSPFSATINGVLVNFTTTTSGSAAYGDPTVADVNDMAMDINLAEISDIVASVTNGASLTLTHTAGGSINIVNVTSDANGNNFAGPGSVSSLALSTPANTTSYSLRLERLDGGPITIRDVQGEFLSNAGVMSGQTGRYALGLNIEQGLRSSRTVVVANIMARDALYPVVGDQAYVLNDDNGEWAFYIYNGSAWTGVGGQRSFETDAKTAEMMITFPSADEPIVTVSSGRKILNVSITIVDQLIVSDDFDFDIICGTTSIWKYSNFNVVKPGTYIEEPSYITPSRQDLRFVNGGGSATGTIQIQVTYL